MEIPRCGIHGFYEVLGIDTDEIRFYWEIESVSQNAVQIAYHIVVITAALWPSPRKVSWTYILGVAFCSGIFMPLLALLLHAKNHVIKLYIV
jgi:hypothetical protein